MIASAEGVAATIGVSLTVIDSLTGTDTLEGGGPGGAVLVPVPLRGTDWVKFDPAPELVRLLNAALSVKVMVSVGVPEGGAT